jgi:hypothetical protein
MTYFQAQLNEALEAIQRVRELHTLIVEQAQCCKDCEYRYCSDCDQDYPCPTIQALDGEQE